MSYKIYFEDEFKIVEDNDPLFDQYIPVKAAGGVVINDNNQLLMIFRRGKWDLPKGKWEEGESMEECAEREVMEETGLSKIWLTKFLMITHHTYVERDKPILKHTHWFLFRAPGNQEVKPQEEEDILKVEWVDRSQLNEYAAGTYALIRDVLDVSAI